MTSFRDSVRSALGPLNVARLKRWVAPLFRRNLTLLGKWYGTNKVIPSQNYTPLYTQHLQHLRRRPVRVLEIGIGGYVGGLQSGGSSLRMWRTWMPKASVVGIDLEPRDFREPRITTVAGDQSDPEFLAALVRDHGPFDVIVDDGSHFSHHVIASFEALFPTMPSGGIYIIEDLHCSYDPEFFGGPPGTAGTSVEMVKTLLDSPTLEGPVRAVLMYPKIAFIQKR